MQTLSQLRTSIFSQIWRDNQPENLVDAHKQIVLEALSQIQTNVKCEQDKNANVVKFCNTWFKCGVTVVPRPKGVIKFLYTIADADWCAPVFYRQVGRKEFECYAREVGPVGESEDASVPVMPMGFRRADSSTDDVAGRSSSGMWTIDGDNLLIAPWIHSSESVVIEWNGVKGASQWTDEDPVSDAIDFRKTVKLYLQYGHERDYGDAQTALTFHNHPKTGTFDEALSELMLDCHEQTRVRSDISCYRPCWCLYDEGTLRALEDGVVRALE